MSGGARGQFPVGAARRWLVAAVLGGVALALLASPAECQSRKGGKGPASQNPHVVVIRDPAAMSGETRYEGTVLRFNRHGLQLKTGTGSGGSGTRRFFKAQNVVDVLFPQSREYRGAEEAYAVGDYMTAFPTFLVARNQVQEPWLKVLITEKIVRCYLSLGDLGLAIEEGCVMAKFEPDMTDRAFAVLPISWWNSPEALEMEGVARKTLAGVPSQAGVLLCASYLLSGPQASSVRGRLESLAKSRDDRLAILAQAQLWRTQLVRATPDRVGEWERLVDQLPPELQSGPRFVLGSAYAQLKNWDAAALAYLRAAWVLPQSESLSEEAVRRAKVALERGGHPAEAAKLQ